MRSWGPRPSGLGQPRALAPSRSGPRPQYPALREAPSQAQRCLSPRTPGPSARQGLYVDGQAAVCRRPQPPSEAWLATLQFPGVPGNVPWRVVSPTHRSSSRNSPHSPARVHTDTHHTDTHHTHHTHTTHIHTIHYTHHTHTERIAHTPRCRAFPQPRGRGTGPEPSDPGPVTTLPRRLCCTHVRRAPPHGALRAWRPCAPQRLLGVVGVRHAHARVPQRPTGDPLWQWSFRGRRVGSAFWPFVGPPVRPSPLCHPRDPQLGAAKPEAWSARADPGGVTDRLAGRAMGRERSRTRPAPAEPA